MEKLADISIFESLNPTTDCSVFNFVDEENPAKKRLEDMFSGRLGYEDILPILVKDVEDGNLDIDKLSDYELHSRGGAASMLKDIKDAYNFSVEASKDPNIPESEYRVPKHYEGITKHYDSILDDIAHGYYSPDYLDEWDMFDGLEHDYDLLEEAKAGSPEAFLAALKSYRGWMEQTKKYISKLEDDLPNWENMAHNYCADDIALLKQRLKKLEEKTGVLLGTDGAKAYLASVGDI